MPDWRTGLLTALILCSASSVASAQVGGVSGGLNSDNGAITGGDINRVNGMNANGTPRQQDPRRLDHQRRRHRSYDAQCYRRRHRRCSRW